MICLGLDVLVAPDDVGPVVGHVLGLGVHGVEVDHRAPERHLQLDVLHLLNLGDCAAALAEVHLRGGGEDVVEEPVQGETRRDGEGDVADEERQELQEEGLVFVLLLGGILGSLGLVLEGSFWGGLCVLRWVS